MRVRDRDRLGVGHVLRIGLGVKFGLIALCSVSGQRLTNSIGVKRLINSIGVNSINSKPCYVIQPLTVGSTLIMPLSPALFNGQLTRI